MRPGIAQLLSRVLLVAALALSPALGYAATPLLLGLMALAGVWWLAPSVALRAPPPPLHGGGPTAPSDPPPPSGGGGPAVGRWRGLLTLAFLSAFTLLLVSALATADLLPLIGFAALLFYAPVKSLLAASPLPTSPVRGEVPLGVSGTISPPSQTPTLPLAGRAGEGGGKSLSILEPTTLALFGALIGLAIALIFRFGLAMPRAAEGFFLNDPHRLAATTLICGFLALAGPWRWWRFCGPAAALAVIVLTSSRAALLAYPVLVLLAAAMLPPRRLPMVFLVFAGLVILGSIALTMTLPGTARSAMGDTVLQLFSGQPVTDVAIATRLKLYAIGWEALLAQPFTGHGWTHLMAPILPSFTAEELAWGAIPHLHNDALNFAVAAGLPGLLAYLLILVTPLLLAWRRGTASYPQVLIAMAYLLLGLPDTMLSAPMHLTLYVVLVALFSPSAPAVAAARARPR